MPKAVDGLQRLGGVGVEPNICVLLEASAPGFELQPPSSVIMHDHNNNLLNPLLFLSWFRTTTTPFEY